MKTTFSLLALTAALTSPSRADGPLDPDKRAEVIDIFKERFQKKLTKLTEPLAETKRQLKRAQEDYKIDPKPQTKTGDGVNGPAVFSSEANRQAQIKRLKSFIESGEKHIKDLKDDPEASLLHDPTMFSGIKGLDKLDPEAKKALLERHKPRTINHASRVGDWGVVLSRQGLVKKKSADETLFEVVEEKTTVQIGGSKMATITYITDMPGNKLTVGKSSKIAGIYIVDATDGATITLKRIPFKIEELLPEPPAKK